MKISRIFIEFEVNENSNEPVKVRQTKRKKVKDVPPKSGQRTYRRYGPDEDAWILQRGNANKHAPRAFRRKFGFPRSQKSLSNRLTLVRSMMRKKGNL